MRTDSGAPVCDATYTSISAVGAGADNCMLCLLPPYRLQDSSLWQVAQRAHSRVRWRITLCGQLLACCVAPPVRHPPHRRTPAHATACLTCCSYTPSDVGFRKSVMPTAHVHKDNVFDINGKPVPTKGMWCVCREQLQVVNARLHTQIWTSPVDVGMAGF